MAEFVTFKISKKLKEKGFREKCICHYYDDTKDIYISSSPQCYNYGGNTSDAPTISQALKWLREQKKITIEMFLYDGTYSYCVKSVTQICEDGSHKWLNDDTSEEEYDSYEEAALAGIDYVLNNLI